MLQRAASNAYSWWCASHIRTNQSKWLNNDLQEMEGRVQAMLKIIEEDADSFAKRAEMYYRRRPELINFVEETYRAYRALAERFDHVSGELHKANNTLATAFPDVQFPMQDDDDDNPEDFLSDGSSSLKPPPRTPQISFHKPPPEIPSLPIKRSKSKKSPDESQPSTVSSQISEDKAKEAIDKLQKSILVLQTEKEFIKSSYEIGVAKYWEIEKTITEMQEEVCLLQDEFSGSSVIEDDEARALMAATALKSCKDTLANLQEHQKQSMKETIVEAERIKTAKEKLRDLNGECGQPDEIAVSETMGTNAPSTTTEDEASVLQQETPDLEAICQKVKDHLEISSQTSVMDLAEKIDELVNKLINLEFTVSSHTAQLHSLRSETDDIHKHLRSLEERKVYFINAPTSPSDSLKQTEAELHKIQSFEKQRIHTDFADVCHGLGDYSEKLQSPKLQNEVKSDDSGKQWIHTDFADACHGLGDNSEKLQSPKLQNQVKNVGSSPFQENGLFNSEKLQSPKLQNQVKSVGSSPFQENGSFRNIEPQKDNEETHTTKVHDTKNNIEEKTSFCPKDPENQVQPEPVIELGNGLVKSQEEEQEEEIRGKDTPQLKNSNHFGTDLEHEDATPNLLQLLSDGLEGKEKILLAEYTTILRSYKETKRKLLEVETKNQEYFAETMLQVKELKSANAMKDGEIRSLRQILSSLQKSSDSKQQNFELLGGLNLEGTTEQDASPVVQDKATEDDLKLYHVEESHATSPIEEKFRKDIDALLDENLEFWLRFSTTFHQIQKFQSEFQTLQADIEKLKDSKAREGGKSEPTPEDKKLGELKSELQVWVEQNAMLRRELQLRFSSLCDIQEEITEVSNATPEAGGIQFTPYQAAKFQGEVLNMQLENNKVADELQAGLDHVKALQAEVETTLSTLSKIQEKVELSASKNSHHSRHTSKNFSNKNKGVPLRSFLYGAKSKKPSIFS